MSQVATLGQIAERLKHIEEEVHSLREIVAEAITKQGNGQSAPAGVQFVDKQALREAFDRLFEDLGIRASPIGAEALQERMRQAGLTGNEFSRCIIEMREE
jgi:hypothetical protein